MRKIVVSGMNESGKELNYIVSIIYQILYIAPVSTVAGELDEFATRSSCGGTTIGEARVRLLRISKRSMWILVKKVRLVSAHGDAEITLYEIQMLGSTTPSKMTCPARCIHSVSQQMTEQGRGIPQGTLEQNFS